MSRYNSIFIIILSFLIVPLISCSSSETDVPDKSATLNLSFEKINEWTNSDLSVIPLPRKANVLADGSLVIVDRSLNTINHFDETGQLIKTIGGQGRGPGEYQNVSAVAIHPDGRVAIADISGAAITVSDIYSGQRLRGAFDPEWNMALQWAGDKLVYSAHPFRIMADNSGDIMMKQFDSTLENGSEFMRLELQRDDPPEDQISCMFCKFLFRDDLSFYTHPNSERFLAYYVTPGNGETFEISRSDINLIENSKLELGQIFDLLNQQQKFMGSVPKPDGTLGVISVTDNTVLFQKRAIGDELVDTLQVVRYRIEG